MLKKYSTYILVILFAGAVGRYTAPVKVQTKEVVKKSTEYIVRTVKSPDGTITKEKIKKDTSQKDTAKIVDFKKPQYKVSLFPKYNFDKKVVEYGGSIEKRVFGPVFAGVYADSASIGIVVSSEF